MVGFGLAAAGEADIKAAGLDPGLAGPFFRGASPLAQNGRTIAIRLRPRAWLAFACAVRFYPSQARVMSDPPRYRRERSWQKAVSGGEDRNRIPPCNA